MGLSHSHVHFHGRSKSNPHIGNNVVEKNHHHNSNNNNNKNGTTKTNSNTLNVHNMDQTTRRGRAHSSGSASSSGSSSSSCCGSSSGSSGSDDVVSYCSTTVNRSNKNKKPKKGSVKIELEKLLALLEEESPETFKQFIIQYHLTTSFQFPKKKESKKNAPKAKKNSITTTTTTTTTTTKITTIHSLPSPQLLKSGCSPKITLSHSTSTNPTFLEDTTSTTRTTTVEENIMFDSRDESIIDPEQIFPQITISHIPEDLIEQARGGGIAFCHSNPEFNCSNPTIANIHAFPTVVENSTRPYSKSLPPKLAIGAVAQQISIAHEGGDKDPQFANVQEEFRREFINFQMKQNKSLNGDDICKLIEDFLDALRKKK